MNILKKFPLRNRLIRETLRVTLIIFMGLSLTGCTEKTEDSFGLELVIPKEEMKEDTANPEAEAVTKDTAQEETKEQEPEISRESIIIHICGAVHNPGVYELERGQRVIDGVKMAGGFLEEADQSYVNQAQILEDGIKIIIPTQEEVKQLEDSLGIGIIDSQTDKVQGTKESGKININTGDANLLGTLPGIGEAKAEAIIKYRTEHGKFQSIEEIMQIEGIKEGLFQKIKDQICIT